MTNPSLSEMSVEELLEQFVINGIAQDRAILDSEIRQGEIQAGEIEEGEIQDGDIDEFTRLFWQMDAINKELLARGGETQLALLRLYGHANMQVRMQAAKLTMITAPIAARAELEAIKNSRHFPQAGDAASALRYFESR